MKIKRLFGAVLLSVLSLGFISTQSASAGECSIQDPCDTYAVMDGNNVVNIIICQPSDCGSGYLHGMRVVPQIKANPTTGLNQGGFMGAKLNNDGSFTLPSQYNDKPKIETIHDNINNIDISISMPNGNGKIIRYEDTSVGANLASIPSTLPIETKVTISANNEEMSFEQRMTENDFNYEVWLSEFELLFQNLNFFDSILFSWGWFI